MKKLLAILSTISIIPSTLPIVSMAGSLKTNIAKEQSIYSVDSFKNIIKIINAKFNDNSENMNSDFIEKILEGFSPTTFYSKSISEKTGQVLMWDSVPRNDLITIKTYTNTYTNPDSLPQKRLTQERTETISETHNFAISLHEKITSEIVNTIKGKIRVPVAEIEDSLSFSFGSETGNNRNWSSSKTTTVSEKIPSQEIMQNPHTILHVLYKVTQSTLDYNGVARFQIESLDENLFRIPLFFFSKDGKFDYILWHDYSTQEVLDVLKEEGYGDQLDNNQKNQYSLISVDNVNNPSSFFVNLPITWNSPNSGLILEHYEEKLF